MGWVVAGLGNPGEDYTGTRHNVGRDFLMAIAKKEGIDVWKEDKSAGKRTALFAKGTFFGKKVHLVLPDTYMNNSGAALKALIKTKKDAEKLVVMHDELDLPLGAVKFSFGSGSGGHNGINSLHTVLKTRDFIRIRIGISPKTPSGKLKKPPQEKVVDFVLSEFRAPEKETLKKAKKTVAEALELLLNEGLEKARTEIHAKF